MYGMGKVMDLAGQLFVRLRVVSFAGHNKYGRATWLCCCEIEAGGCGGTKIVSAGNLRTGHTTSCGCLNSDNLRARNFKHGRSKRRRIAPEFAAWVAMKQRCSNPNGKYFKDYGGRGITVCARWRESFENFYADMGPRPSTKHSVDRIDVNGNYEPGNCRWATQRQQSRNTRANSHLTFNGETLCISEWAERVNLSANTLSARLKRGWAPETALSTPTKIHHRRKGASVGVCPLECGPTEARRG